MAYQIKPLKSARDNIYKTKAQKNYIMPPPGTTVIVGSTGSGKTTIVGNLLSNKHMLKDYYDKIYVFCLSPCTTLIDNVEQIQEEDVFTDDNPDKLRELYEINKKSVKSVGFKRTKHVLFILDDIVQSNTFMNSKIMTE
jgi:septin family protein